jgi:dehydrogenase/reductase SDR family protein 13
MISSAEGAETSLHCVTSPVVAGESGHYYEHCRRKDPSAAATPERAGELWDRTIAWLAPDASDSEGG